VHADIPHEHEGVTVKTMTEVLTEHSKLQWSFEYGGFVCVECGWQETYARLHARDAQAGARAAHYSAALTAAGFGPVKEAWDEGYTTGNAHNGRRDANPYRAATIEADQ
jgi:hypothetical protein